MSNCMGVLQGTIICSSVPSRNSFRPMKSNPFQHISQTNPHAALAIHALSPHLICSIWNQDEAERERDFESLQNTQSYPRPAKKQITVCGGIGGGQTPTATPFRLPNAPQLNMST